MAKGGDGAPGNGEPSAFQTKRSRWATRKLTIKSSGNKRRSIMDRIHKRTGSTEKKRRSAGSASMQTTATANAEAEGEGNGDANSTTSEEEEGRYLYFNQPLPADMVDEDGHPKVQYTRNKIRTAKYTPVSFIPKNLWFQFQNIANVFFLFLVILAVSANMTSEPQ
jgi:phospholipid-translocating ATPase